MFLSPRRSAAILGAVVLVGCLAALPLAADQISSPRLGPQHGEEEKPMLELPGRQYQAPTPSPEQTLILPPNWQPSPSNPLPPVPQPLAEIDLPEAFLGCWHGRPNGFDHVYPLSSIGKQIGEPGEITFCYQRHGVEVPQAEVYISPGNRAVDLAMNLGLAHMSFVARGVKTEIYSITPTGARGRTTLEVDPTWHFLHIIPVDVSAQPSKVDWKATVIDAQTIRIEAYQVHWAFGAASFGATWHADFKPVGNPSRAYSYPQERFLWQLGQRIDHSGAEGTS